MGKRSRSQGKAFEVRVRKDLVANGWRVSRWDNNIKDDVCVQAKGKFNPFTKRVMNMSAGFPDFVVYRYVGRATFDSPRQSLFDVQFIECKMAGKLDKEEKEKARWYLEQKYCSKFLIAKKVKEKNRVKIVYDEVVL